MTQQIIFKTSVFKLRITGLATPIPPHYAALSSDLTHRFCIWSSGHDLTMLHRLGVDTVHFNALKPHTAMHWKAMKSSQTVVNFFTSTAMFF